MSTNNNAAQTLFRFVSLRNPQLTETKTKNFAFIQRPEKITTSFDTAVTSRESQTTKLQAMSTTSQELEPGMYKNEKEIENSEFFNLLVIGRKISKKEIISDEEWAYTKEYYGKISDSGKSLNDTGYKVLQHLWSNLIYQVVSQKDFYVKEAISHILKAVHLGFVQFVNIDEEIIKINGEDPIKNALNAKIVMPVELFVESNAPAYTSNSRTAVIGTLSEAAKQRLKVNAQKELTASKALQTTEALKNLNTELERVQKAYFETNSKAYSEAYNAYMRENQEKIAIYESKLAEIEKMITPETKEEEKIRLYESIKPFEVQPFQFSYPAEIDLQVLRNRLSPESFELFLELFSVKYFSQKSFPVGEAKISQRQLQVGESQLQIDDSYQSFSTIIDEVQNHIHTQSRIALENTSLPQEQYVNIGGASVPVAGNHATTHLAYSLYINWYRRIFLAGRGFVQFSFEVENSSWQVASAKLSATTNNGNFEENYGTIEVVNNKIVFPIMSPQNFTNITALTVQIFFSNGRETTLQINNPINNNLYNGVLLLKPIKENLPDTEAPKNATTPKRKNFGIKRLGIADYLKVVQSVHAYVPGLVSNIENVMASELRHKSSVARDYSEVTDTTSKSQETEKISDTSKTSRTDMQTEVAKELEKQQNITAHTSFSYNSGVYKFDIGAEYANNTAQHDSTRQAVMKSQEITERAMERVLTKINEERVQKIIKEYTETNVHEFDNRGKVTNTDNPDAAKPQHITGVYRWIDMKYKNQIYNYGKRTMFEFMVPEPAKLHRLATAVSKAQVLTAPIDPRKAPTNTMANPKMATQQLLEYWAEIYNVDLDTLPANTTKITFGPHNGNLGGNESMQNTQILGIPNNYVGTSAKVFFGCQSKTKFTGCYGLAFSDFRGGMLHNDRVDNSWFSQESFDDARDLGSGLNIKNNDVFYFQGGRIDAYNFSIEIGCELSDEFLQEWKQTQFKKIIDAYEAAYQKFLDEQKRLDDEQKAKEAEAKEKQGNFYRYMEADVLKHNCIAYLLQDYLHTLGQNFTNGADKMEDFAVILDENLDQYTTLAKFMEQAFEWEIMDYHFYPYYWANRGEWQKMYISESVDPLFRSFLQAGMARVVVTVKPGFEDAVQFFLETGLVWNGGEVPVIGDPMYMSIVDEMRQPTGKPQGKYWITRVPTTLTILQAGSAGLKVDQALPIFPENDPTNCENPSELENASSFGVPQEVRMIGGGVTTSTLD